MYVNVIIVINTTWLVANPRLKVKRGAFRKIDIVRCGYVLTTV